MKLKENIPGDVVDKILNHPNTFMIDITDGIFNNTIYFEINDVYYIAEDVSPYYYEPMYVLHIGEWVDIDKMWFKEFLEV